MEGRLWEVFRAEGGVGTKSFVISKTSQKQKTRLENKGCSF